MRLSEQRLKEVIFEEAYGRILDDLIVEELFRVLLEQDDEIDEDEYLEQWKTNSSFRQKVKDFFAGFDALPSIKKKAAIVALGILGAAGTDFAGEHASQAQAREIASELRADAQDAREKYFGTAADWSHFRDAATAEGASPIAPEDDEGIQQAKAKFMRMGVDQAPIIGDVGLGMSTGEQQFYYTPADQIPDDEQMPFVGMSKADWESTIRRWLTEPDGRDRLEKFIGTQGRGQSIFWAYGPREKLFYHAADEAPEGQRGMWLPPEWSVAYDVVQKNKARAGNQPSPEDEIGIPLGTDSWLQENLRKYLHSLATVL
tara:strand:- start:1052 stop:1999 length:948 start_codon:yes stop_codon:yes gene_type:complete